MEPELIKKFYTGPSDIDKKFEKQESIIQKIMVKHNKDVLRNIKAQKQTLSSERTILTTNTVMFLILNFLFIMLIIIWLLIYLETFEPNIKIIEITPTEFSSNSGNDEGEKLKKSLFQSYEANKLRLIKISFLLLFFINKIWKRINISKGNFYENENLNDFTRLNDVLENYLGENKNMFENESSENIINMVENILNNSSEVPIDIVTQNPDNSQEAENKENPNSAESWIIPACILGSSMIISSIAPTLLELIIKSVS